VAFWLYFAVLISIGLFAGRSEAQVRWDPPSINWALQQPYGETRAYISGAYAMWIVEMVTSVMAKAEDEGRDATRAVAQQLVDNCRDGMNEQRVFNAMSELSKSSYGNLAVVEFVSDVLTKYCNERMHVARIF